jgi:regulatory protein
MLHDAALAYLARYAATEASLRRVLDRRVGRWARIATATEDADAVAAQAAAARRAIREVVARLVAAGAVNDTAYAESRARSLIRSGRSRRAAAAYLAAKGVAAETVRAVLSHDDEDVDLAAALILARRRRIGPFRISGAPNHKQELAVFARAGFSRAVAQRALAMETDQAETLVNRLRR